MIITLVIENVIPLVGLLIFVQNLSLETSSTQVIFNHIEFPSVCIWNCMIKGSKTTKLKCLVSKFGTVWLKLKSYADNTNPDEEWCYSSDLSTFPFVLKPCSVCAIPTIENYGCGIDFFIQANLYVLF